MQTISFYKDRLAINILADDVKNAEEIYQAANSHACIGILSSRFESVEQGIAEVNEWKKTVPSISVGLGNGDPAQFYKAAAISAATAPAHVNQPFTGAGYTAGLLHGSGANNTKINAMIAPTGTLGMVLISTGVESSKIKGTPVDVDTAITMVKDMGVPSIKFFPMGGLDTLGELKVVASACSKHQLEMIEPTGGIDLKNFEAIAKVSLEAGVPKVMPHIYSSIIDKESGKTRAEDVEQLLEKMRNLI